MTDLESLRVIRDVETLKVLADRTRMQILELAMADPDRTWTAKDFAGEVGVAPTKIYYHLHQLEQHGLLRIRETRMVNGILEKHYGTAQLDITFYRSRSDDGAAEIRDVVRMMLERTRDDIDQRLATGVISAGDDAPDDRRMMVSHRVVRTSPARAAAFRQELLDLMRRFEQDGDGAGQRFAMLVAIHPL